MAGSGVWPIGTFPPGLWGASDFASVVGYARSQFVADLIAIIGQGNLRYLYAPALADTTTSTDLSPNARTITNNASLASRLTAQGFGYLASYNGTSQGANMPDTDDMSFGDGAVDSAFSIVSLVNVTDTAAERVIAGKYNTSGAGGEYYMAVSASDTLALSIRDQSAAKVAFRVSNAGITQGSTHLLAATYSAATGGATAANDMTLYQDAAVIASTATNDAGYVAMENLTTSPEIGARTNNGVSWFSGGIAMVLVCATALTAAQLTSIKTATNGFYGLSL